MKFSLSAIFIAMAGFAAAEEVVFGAADGSQFRANVNKGQTVEGMFALSWHSFPLKTEAHGGWDDHAA